MESDPDPLVRGAAPDPHQYVTDTKQYTGWIILEEFIKLRVSWCAQIKEKGMKYFQIKSLKNHV
jgi:hypothetical protein